MMEALACHPLGQQGLGVGGKIRILMKPRHNQSSNAAVKKEASTGGGVLDPIDPNITLTRSIDQAKRLLRDRPEHSEERNILRSLQRSWSRHERNRPENGHPLYII